MNPPPPDAPTMLNDPTSPSSRPVIFGEVLFDCFGDGRRALGGAPFNVAWNLQGLGLHPHFVSGIGNDENGNVILDAMKSWGMDTSGLQLVSDRPTGVVTVSVDQGQPSYEILLDQAYDQISVPDLTQACSDANLLYHGSLVFRGNRSRTSLTDLIENSELPRFVDINIRQPHFDAQWLPTLLGGARWIKLNDDELEDLSGVTIDGEASIQSGVDRLKEVHGSEATYLVTCGSKGAYALEHNELHHAPAPVPSKMVDTVGAGDSFSAAVISGLIRNRPLPDCLAVATKLASRVCGLNGATVADPTVFAGLND